MLHIAYALHLSASCSGHICLMFLLLVTVWDIWSVFKNNKIHKIFLQSLPILAFKKKKIQGKGSWRKCREIKSLYMMEIIPTIYAFPRQCVDHWDTSPVYSHKEMNLSPTVKLYSFNSSIYCTLKAPNEVLSIICYFCLDQISHLLI